MPIERSNLRLIRAGEIKGERPAVDGLTTFHYFGSHPERLHLNVSTLRLSFPTRQKITKYLFSKKLRVPYYKFIMYSYALVRKHNNGQVITCDFTSNNICNMHGTD